MDPNREPDILGNYDFVNPVVMTDNEQQASSNYDRSSLFSALFNNSVASSNNSASLQSPAYYRGNVLNSRWYGLGESNVGGGDHLITNSHPTSYYANNNNAHEFQYEQGNNSNMVGSSRQSVYQEMAYPMVTRNTNSVITREQEWEDACIPKSRWIPTAEQIHVLESLFNAGTTTPSRDQIAEITAHLKKYGNVGEANIFYWFQNRKARAKRKLRQAAAASASSNNNTTERRGRETNTLLLASSQKKTGCHQLSTKTSSGSSPDHNPPTDDSEYDPYSFQLQNEATAYVAAIAESKAIQRNRFTEQGNLSSYSNSQICDSNNIRHPFMPGKMVIEQNVLDPRMNLSLAPPALHIGDSLLSSNPRRTLDPFTNVDPSVSTSSIETTEHGSVYQEKFWSETYRSFNSLSSDEWDRKQ